MPYVPSPAGFWKRYIAYFIDTVILYVAVEILSMLFFSLQGKSEIGALIDLLRAVQTDSAVGSLPDPHALIQKIETVILPALIFSTGAYLLIGSLYFSVSESSRYQATVGKYLIGIKVTTAEGQPITWPRAMARYFAAGLSWMSLNLGHAIAAWTPQRRALHDYIANTRVENIDPEKTAIPLWGWLVILAHGLIFIGLCFLLFAMVLLTLNAIGNI